MQKEIGRRLRGSFKRRRDVGASLCGGLAMGERHCRSSCRLSYYSFLSSSWRRPYQIPRYTLWFVFSFYVLLWYLGLRWFDANLQLFVRKIFLIVSDGRSSIVPSYRNTHQALFTIARTEVCRLLFEFRRFYHFSCILDWNRFNTSLKFSEVLILVKPDI